MRTGSKLFRYGSLLFIACLALLPIVGVGGAPPPTGVLYSQGSVSVNGTQMITQSTLVTGSHIITEQSGNAVAMLKALGKVFIDNNTELMLNLDQNMVKLDLRAGSVRLQQSTSSIAEVWVKGCHRVEVIDGEVMTMVDGDDKWNSLLKSGELQEYKTDKSFIVKGKSPKFDYRVALISCGIAAAAVPGGAAVPVAALATVGAVSAGGITAIPLLREDPKTLSRAKP